MALRDMFKTVTKNVIGWGGAKLGVPPTVTKFLSETADKLFTKKEGVGGGDFELIDTSVQPQSFGRKMGFIRPSSSRASVDYARTVNPETLNAAWDSRLSEYYTKTYKVARTTTLKA